MKEKLFQFLKALERALVPPSGCHHSITYNQYGNDTDGWEERLGLHVWTENSCRTLFVIDGDLERPAEDLVAEVVALCKQPPSTGGLK